MHNFPCRCTTFRQVVLQTCQQIKTFPAAACAGKRFRASLIGVVSILIGWIRHREPFTDLLVNVLTFMTFPLLVGVGFQELLVVTQTTSADLAFYVFVFGAFALTILMNLVMIGGYTSYVERSSLIPKILTGMIPLLPSELAAALMAVGVAYLYLHVGLAGIALFGVVLVTFQYLLGALLVSQQRAEEARARAASSSPASRWGC